MATATAIRKPNLRHPTEHRPEAGLASRTRTVAATLLLALTQERSPMRERTSATATASSASLSGGSLPYPLRRYAEATINFSEHNLVARTNAELPSKFHRYRNPVSGGNFRDVSTPYFPHLIVLRSQVAYSATCKSIADPCSTLAPCAGACESTVPCSAPGSGITAIFPMRSVVPTSRCCASKRFSPITSGIT